MTSKKIVIFMPSIEGYGVEKNLFIITNYLSKYFQKIFIITTSKKYKKRFENKIYLISPRSKFWDKGGRLKKYFICIFLLIKYLIINKNSLVFSFQANLYATYITKLFGSKIIIRLNSAPYGWSKNFLKKYIFKYSFLLVDKIIVNSLEFKKDIKKRFLINSTCIYNPLNKNEIISKSKIFSKKIYNRKNSLKIINVGRLVNQKNQIIILEAVKSLVQEHKIDIELVLIGEGNLKRYYVNFISNNNLNKIVKIMKFNKNPYNLIIQSDLFILSSKFEGLPNVLLEAATLGKFIISSNCPTGPKEILLNGRGGLLYDTNNTNDLKNKILFFINNRNKSQQKLFNAKKNLHKFDYKKNLKRYLEVINKFI